MRVRKKIFGTPEHPRLSVFRSSRHIYAQLVDDWNGVTIASASSLKTNGAGGGNVAAAATIGDDVARKALDLGVRRVQFDRNGYKYHGRVKALADAARKAGLSF